MRVLLAVDDSGFADNLLRGVVSGVRRDHTDVIVLHVLQPVDTVPPPEMAVGYDPELEEAMQPARVLVERIAGGLRSAGFTAQTGVRIGDVANTILDQASELRADLIVVGSHGHRNIHNFLLSSVAESVAHRAECSVVIVRAVGGM
jgi:nucleotide-binding universal stress UspA family protein